MKRKAHPSLSLAGQEALASYEHWLREREDLAPASIRNDLSDLRHFIAWYEHVHDCFTAQEITTPALTRCRTYLQTAQRQKPASVNRSLISLKRYFGWVSQQHIITYDPSSPSNSLDKRRAPLAIWTIKKNKPWWQRPRKQEPSGIVSSLSSCCT